MKRLALLALLLACGTAQAEGWACTIDQAVGFALNKKTGKWFHATFDSPQFKYTIKKTQFLDVLTERFIPGAPHEWQVSEPIGNPIAYCGATKEQKFICLPSAELLPTFGQLYSVAFNPKTLRIRVSYLAGYVEDGVVREDSPMIQIGTCSPT
jgi:hypothetical protein